MEKSFMRRFSIHISTDDTRECITNFKKLLDAVASDEKTTYEITVDVSGMEKAISDTISKLIKAEQEYGEGHKAIFKNIISCQYHQLNKKVLGCILRYGADVIIQYFGNPEKDKDLFKAIKKLQKQNIPYYLNVICESDEVCDSYLNLKKTSCAFEIANVLSADIDLIKEFDDWCAQESCCPTFKTFEDILYRLLLGYTHRDCRHSSCLGKRVCMKSNGDLYFCHSYSESAFLKNVSEVKGLSDIFESDNFGKVLFQSLEKRNKCKGCSGFSVCFSGCPLLTEGSDTGCTEEKYCKLVSHIAEYLHEKLDVKHELFENPVIRKMVLVSIAYKGKLEINTLNKEVKA